MSRFFKSMIVLLAIVAMATPVMAEDMLSLGGQMRVRGWYIDADQDSTKTWADQRLRIGGKLSIADGVSITFRTDITESNWGSNDSTYGSGRSGSTQQWDRAHLDIDLGSFSVRAGQQYLALGISGFDAQTNGITVKTKGNMPITAFFMLQDDNNTGSTLDDQNADGFYYGANLGHKGESYKANIFAAGQSKVSNSEEAVYVIGVDLNYDLSAFKIVAEAEFFTGDADADNDAFGTQFYVDGSMAASETMTFGGQLFYAAGDDEDTQYIILGNDFGGWDPINEAGSGLNNEQITPGSATALGTDARPYGFFGNNAGVIAGRLYGNFQLSEAFHLGASIAYLEPEDDSNVETESVVDATVGIKYQVMANTSVGAQLVYLDLSDNPDADSIVMGGLGLFVNF
ncbi:MAG: hypothetical protein QNK24_05895 [Desulfuromusa sp.]|nr:hypothetical protein [Desulfuromusa sp.]